MKALIYKGLQAQFWRIVKIEKQIEPRFYGRNKKGEYYGNRRKYNV